MYRSSIRLTSAPSPACASGSGLAKSHDNERPDPEVSSDSHEKKDIRIVRGECLASVCRLRLVRLGG